MKPLTTVARAAIDTDPTHGAVTPPLYLSSNFSFEGLGQKRTYDYTRSGNPTRDDLGRALADLEGGAGAVVTSSGMSAVTLALHLVPPGGTIVAPHDGYGGTWRLLDALARRGVLKVRFADLTDPTSRRAALREGADVVWVETPSNPLLRITDIAAVVREAGDATVIVDNTFLSPLGQRPLDLGADVVVHSTTKYLNGHSDVVGGVAIARDRAVHEQLAWWGNCLGLTGAPFDSWLTLRGLRTLGVRMRQHEANARDFAEAALAHPAVVRVYWPGLVDHPGHELAVRQQTGFGGMVSIELADAEAVAAVVSHLRCFTLAESLGGVESLVAHPASMTHASMSPEARRRAGIGDGLLRFSVGIEDPDDLVADLKGALDAVPEVQARNDRRQSSPRVSVAMP